jgi:hypothetical protein
MAPFYSDQGLLSDELSQYRIRVDGQHEKQVIRPVKNGLDWI